MLTKLCNKCSIEKIIDDFSWEGNRFRPVCKSCREEQRRFRRKITKEERLPKVREYNDKNRERINRQTRERRYNNPNSAIAQRIHASKRRCAVGTYNSKDVEWLWEYQDGKCNYCQLNLSEVLYHIDHIIPIKLGGTNDPLNLQILCAKCNMRKGAQNPIEYEKSIGLKNTIKQYMDDVYCIVINNNALKWVLASEV